MSNRHIYNISIHGRCGTGKEAAKIISTLRNSKSYKTSQALPATIKSLIRQATILAETQCAAINPRAKLVIDEIRSTSRVDPE